ncbi:MAG: 4,5-DOPA dioxygenase extradiol [Candidatus Baltobacteraceae bacterium]
MPKTLPALFVGHGNPMNALAQNAFTRAWSSLGSAIGRPRAILCVSAHWYLPGTSATAMQSPRTIHDFGGFPRALFEVRYPAPGDPNLADRLCEILAPVAVGLDRKWGLDHGAWSILVHMFPKADVPVVQLSIDETQPPSFHYEIGKRLAAIRDEGVLLLGSGNVVHNLEAYAWGEHPSEPYPWAARFEQEVRRLLRAGEDAPLVEYERLGGDAMLSIPTPEHYLPLLYVLGARREGEAVEFPVDGVDGGSISMLAVRFG